MSNKILKDKKLKGIAILTVLISLTLLIAIVTDLSSNEMIKYKLAINDRDSLRAEGLALSAANLSKIVLMIQEPLQGYMAKFAEMGVTMPSFAVWELIPVDSELLKSITGGDFDILDLDNKEEKKPKENEEKKSLSGPYVPPKGGYGGFDGTFSAQIKDEESKISIRRWAKLEKFEQRKAIYEQILRVLSRPKSKNLLDASASESSSTPLPQVIGNIYDYISPTSGAVDVNAPKESWGRDNVGPKQNSYSSADASEIIKPKKAPFDSMAELRLVPGVNDAIYRILSDNISIYSESDTINILSANEEVMSLVFYSCTKNNQTGSFQQPGFEEELVRQWAYKKSEGEAETSAAGVMKFLESNNLEVDKESCEKIIGTQSKTFTVKALATVGNVTRTILMRLRSAGGIMAIYQFQYL